MNSDLLVLIRRVAFLPRTVNHGIVSTIFPILFVLLCLPGLGSGQSGAGPDPRNEPYNYTRLSPAMAVIVVILIAALFFMGFFSIYIRLCIGSRADGSINPVTGARRAAAANAASRGLDASVIDSFPTFVYAEVKNLKIGKDALECAVCLNEFEDDETLRLLPKCDHVFHPHCIGAWLEGHVTCPVCRTNLSEHNPDDELPITQSQNDVEVQTEPEPEQVAAHNQPPELRGTDGSGSLRGNRTRGSRSGRTRVKFPRSHSTGHSLVQPGEDTERFTLRVPAEVRKQIMANRELNRSNSLVVLPREGSSRRGKRVERIQGRSDRWLFLRTPSFIWRSQREGNSVQRGGTIQLGGRAGSTRDSARSDRWSFLRAPSFLGRNSSVRTPQDPTSGQPSRTDGSTGDSVRLPV